MSPTAANGTRAGSSEREIDEALAAFHETLDEVRKWKDQNDKILAAYQQATTMKLRESVQLRDRADAEYGTLKATATCDEIVDTLCRCSASFCALCGLAAESNDAALELAERGFGPDEIAALRGEIDRLWDYFDATVRSPRI